jgi:hypothetical protein
LPFLFFLSFFLFPSLFFLSRPTGHPPFTNRGELPDSATTGRRPSARSSKPGSSPPSARPSTGSWPLSSHLHADQSFSHPRVLPVRPSKLDWRSIRTIHGRRSSVGGPFAIAGG